MAKFNSSRTKTARNPGAVGRTKTFNQAKNRTSGGSGNRRGKKDGFKGENRRGDERDFRPRRRENVDMMDFSQATDYVRPENPTRGQRRPDKHFNPLNFLRKDEEDGVVSLPKLDYVEMDDRDFSRLGNRKKGERAEKSERSGRLGKRSEKNDSIFRKSVRGSKIAGKFMKDFRDADGRGNRDSRGMQERSGNGTVSRKPRTKNTQSRKISTQEGERLQKVLATAGFGSRRDCEEFIVTGRVMVDREVVTELGTRVLPHQTIHLDGELVRRPKKFVYYALNKPGNVICTNDDPDGRRRALDFIHENVPGLFPVGRLDLHSEGLLLITNDGELANRLTHPSYEVPKVYRVRVSGTPTRGEIAQICKGVYLAEGMAKADEVYLKHAYRDGTAILEITLREGRNREIRRILAKVGHNVLDLVRISIGDVKLGKIPVGGYRQLTSQEVKSLKKLVGMTDYKSDLLSSASVSKEKPKEEPKKVQKVTKKVKPRRVREEAKTESVVESQMESTVETERVENTADALYAEWKAEMNGE
ncbi:MAG: pseudouridine synthase [Planctomycetia bacterium]|nr:pseudouridine synthase [Planctomycetia bacterium]